MLPFIAAGLVGGYLIKKFMSDDNPVEIHIANSSQGLQPSEEFVLLFANVLFRIDGVLHKNEEKYLEIASDNASNTLHEKIKSTLSSKETFSILRKQYKALDDYDRSHINDKFYDLSKIDNDVSEYEEAALIQLSQIVSDYDKIPLYVACNGNHENLILTHDLFELITEEQWRSKFPRSSSEFTVGQIYTNHPFNEGDLIPFSLSCFNDCQNEFFGGIIPIMKELGASRIFISESREQFQESMKKIELGVEGSYNTINSKGSLSSTEQSEAISEKRSTVEVKFDGKGTTFFGKMFPSITKKKLTNKYQNNPEYLSLIENRFGSNKINYFEYQMKSKSARKLANSLQAAATFNAALVKGGASFSKNNTENTVEVIEKFFRAEFHS